MALGRSHRHQGVGEERGPEQSEEAGVSARLVYGVGGPGMVTPAPGRSGLIVHLWLGKALGEDPEPFASEEGVQVVPSGLGGVDGDRGRWP